MSGKIICPKCGGNGYIYSFNHDDRKKYQQTVITVKIKVKLISQKM